MASHLELAVYTSPLLLALRFSQLVITLSADAAHVTRVNLLHADGDELGRNFPEPYHFVHKRLHLSKLLMHTPVVPHKLHVVASRL